MDQAETKREKKQPMPDIWMHTAFSLAIGRAQCSKLRVGALITTKDYRTVIGNGYNGGPAGTDYKCMNRADCQCVHAEINALVNAGERIPSKVMFVTMFPCLACATAIINAGIKKVYYHDDYLAGSRHWEDRATIDDYFKQAEVKIIKI